MARRKSRTSRSSRLELKLPVQVRPVPFEPFESIRHLDVDRLSRAARARFEVGQFEGGCCRRVVQAVVRNGMVTGLELEPCPKRVRMTPELRKVVKATAKAFAKGRRAPGRLPVPVRQFLGSSSALTIDTFGCFMICIFGWCLLCCFDTRDPTQDGCDFFEDDWPVASP